MKQKKKSTGFERDIRRTPSVSKKAPKPTTTVTPAPKPTPSPVNVAPPPGTDAPKWHFKNDKGKWELFDPLTTRMLEGVSKTGRKTTTLSHGKYAGKNNAAFIDFQDMTETIKIKPDGDDSDSDSDLSVTSEDGEGKETKELSEKVIMIKRTPPLQNITKNSATTTTTTTTDQKFESEEGVMKQVKKLTKWKVIKEVPEDETCPICLCEFEEDDVDEECLVRLSKCKGHWFHSDCIVQCFKASYLQCPICSHVYGVRVGTMPDGTIRITHHKQGVKTCAGYTDCGTIEISYNFPNGTQDDRHPHPGQPYKGTSRTSYLPDNAEGQKVLKLFQIAWDRKLLMQVGRSVTTGEDNQVTWAGIHHKTNTTGGATSYGYPDATYLSRVQEELASKGVTLPS